MRARRVGSVLLALLLGAGVAACGDDGGSDDGDAVDQVDRDVDRDRDDDDGRGDDGDDGDAPARDDEGDIDLGIFGDDECVQMALAFSGLGAAFAADGDELAEVEAFFREAVDDVPADLRDDFEIYSRAMGEYLQGLRDLGLADGGQFDATDPAAMARFTELMAVFDSPEMQAAADNIGAFFDNNCQG